MLTASIVHDQAKTTGQIVSITIASILSIPETFRRDLQFVQLRPSACFRKTLSIETFVPHAGHFMNYVRWLRAALARFEGAPGQPPDAVRGAQRYEQVLLRRRVEQKITLALSQNLKTREVGRLASRSLGDRTDRW